MCVKRIIGMLLIAILFVISIMLSINSYTTASLLLNILCSILLIIEVKNLSRNYVNYSLFFIGFSVLYGLSGPINTLWGEGLHRMFSIPYYIDEFLIAYALANIGFICGLSIYNLTSKKILQNKRVNSCFEMVEKSDNVLLNIAIILVLIGTVFEIINMMRIGGFNVLFTGKANYQGLSTQLTLTLPSSIIINIAFSYLSLYLGYIFANNKKLNARNKIKVILFLLIASPFLLINIVLGRRGTLLTLFISVLVGVSYFKPLKKLKPKLVIILIIFYIFLSFLYANRAIVGLIIEEPKSFVEMAFTKERVVKALNPGVNEFGAAFGNFNEYYIKYGTNAELKLGSTYIKGLVMPIPSFIYPGEKPIQITYEFRDEFFPQEAKRSAIAGTGFSSILEAYMNFKYLGIFLIYLLIGYFMQVLDNKYKYSNLSIMVLYISSSSQTQVFHRSAFGGIFGNVFLSFIVILFISFVNTLLNSNDRNTNIEDTIFNKVEIL